MITGIKITHVEAHRDKDEDMTGLNVNIGIDSVSVKNGEATIMFNYAATYAEGVGELKMKGAIITREDAKLTKEITDKWEKEKKLPDLFAEIILNAINYACGTNGVFVVRPVNLSPPIVPPRIQLGNEQKK
jgi:CRISPR/Cas system CSM-associated protein Csm3 (group 7 of RAMP superfamily)